MFNFFGFQIEQILCVGKAVASVRNCSDCWKSFLIVGKNISIKKSEKLIPDYKRLTAESPTQRETPITKFH